MCEMMKMMMMMDDCVYLFLYGDYVMSGTVRTMIVASSIMNELRIYSLLFFVVPIWRLR